MQIDSKRIERFWSRVRKTESCWVWLGNLNKPNAYGHFRIATDAPGVKSKILAHRLAWILAGKDIPDGKELDHLCRNRRCVNPEHLELVTHAENVRRGVSPSALHRLKTHCPIGHPLSGANLMLMKNGRGRIARACVVCKGEQQARRIQRDQLARTYTAAHSKTPSHPLF